MHENWVVFMAKPKTMDIEFGRRIVLLRERKKLSRAAAAKQSQMGLSALQQYESGILPGPKNTDKLIAFYGCSKAWLLAGEGEPFPAAREKYAVACDPPAEDVLREPVGVHPTARSGSIDPLSSAQGFRVSDALTMTARVLESGTSYATALYLNIVHFERAVTAESRIAHLESNMISIKKELVDMIEALQKENRVLGSELNRLKATHEGPDGRSDDLTNASGVEKAM